MLTQFSALGETHAFWSDAFHPGFHNSAEVKQLVSDVREANCNAVFVEVRRRGDAFYQSSYEPKAANVPTDYDPLGDLIKHAHSPFHRDIEVHAWLTMYPLGKGVDAVSVATNHPYFLHRDWLCKDSQGQTYDGREYTLDPGNAQVQEYLFNIAMDVVSRYDVDGLNLDYVHYPGRNWGYNSNAVFRFNQRFHRKGAPEPSDPLWAQFRRDQVTALVRKIYLSAIALKPKIKVSAATVTQPPAPKDDVEWTQSSAYARTYQDWRSWMSEGILDINMPMVYVPESNPAYRTLFADSVEFATEHRYNRQVVISPGLFMNPVSTSLAQIRSAMMPGRNGKCADGVCLYSYASYSNDATPREQFVSTLTRTAGAGREKPVFAKAVSPPEMPWKTKPTMGHIKGFVYGAGSMNRLDGAAITIKGPASRNTISDATGFYGSVDLLPGDYTVTASFNGNTSDPKPFTVKKGRVTTVDLQF